MNMVKWFHVLVTLTCTQLNGFKYLFVGFYDISSLLAYLMSNIVYTNKLNRYDL